MDERICLPRQVLAFWLASGPARWFEKDEAFDEDIRVRFWSTYEAATAGHLRSWANRPDTALALVIVLDQFPRNMFRGSMRAYAADSLARAVAARTIAQGFDKEIAMPARIFFYMPFEHSESSELQERCVAHMRKTGDAEHVRSAELHADIIRRFGRFPHRNIALGRLTTSEEQAFLDAGGFQG